MHRLQQVIAQVCPSHDKAAETVMTGSTGNQVSAALQLSTCSHHSTSSSQSSSSSYSISFADVQQAAQRLKNVAHLTPIHTSTAIDKMAGK
jgi:hypothetical protein